jgi:hypothetical protein
MDSVKIHFAGGWGRKFDPEKQFSYVLNHYNFIHSGKDADFVVHVPANRKVANRLLRNFRKKDNKTHIYYTAEQIWRDGEFDFIFSFEHETPEKPHHFRIPNYPLRMWKHGFDYSDLIKGPDYSDIIMGEDRKFCCFVTSNQRVGPGAAKRREFFEALSRYKRVDSGGKVLNNIGDIAPSPGPYGDVLGKIEFMRGYKFSISFENKSYPGYVTEKITEAMLAGCIPLYCGDPLVHTDFNTGSFVNFEDVDPNSTPLDNVEEMVRRVAEIDQDDDLYEKILREPFLHGNKKTKMFDKDYMMRGWHRAFSSRGER